MNLKLKRHHENTQKDSQTTSNSITRCLLEQFIDKSAYNKKHKNQQNSRLFLLILVGADNVSSPKGVNGLN